MRLIALAAAVAISAGALAHSNALAAGAVITSIDCAPATHAPGAFDIIRINNTGAAPQDLGGWQLTSDPEATERMSLDVTGTLDPGEPLIIVAGPHGTPFPADNIFLWSPIGVLRDSGEPADYVRLPAHRQRRNLTPRIVFARAAWSPFESSRTAVCDPGHGKSGPGAQRLMRYDITI